VVVHEHRFTLLTGKSGSQFQFGTFDTTCTIILLHGFPRNHNDSSLSESLTVNKPLMQVMHLAGQSSAHEIAIPWRFTEERVDEIKFQW
jgi:hypothetical protein